MAVMDNVLASLVSFAINGAASRLINNVGTYGTSDILNGGEVVENLLTYTFKVTGLKDHTIQSITIYSLLLTDNGELNSTKRLSMSITDYGTPFAGNVVTNDLSKTIVPQQFSLNLLIELNDFIFSVNISTTATASCFYGMLSISIDLLDIPYSVKLTFSGPTSNRSASNIEVSTLIVTLGSIPVTFSKDPVLPFNPTNDNVEGRIYMRENGIFVDGVLYGTVAPATGTLLGLVKLFNNFEIDPEDGGIIAPTTPDAVVTPQLLYNTIATLKNYTDEQVGGILAPDIFIEEQVIVTDEITQEEHSEIQDRQLEKITFSDEFEAIGEDNRIRIKWLEVI